MVRFGVIGLGFMGRAHLASLARHPEAEIAAVCDVEPDRLAGPLAPGGGNLDTGGKDWDESAVRRCAAAEEVLADGGIDAVVLAVPTHLHADMTVAALSSGKHIFCEKPMALNLPDCDRMIEAARKADRVLVIGHCIRFWGDYVAAAEMLRSGRYGLLQALLMSRRGGVPSFGARGWFTDHARSGGAVLDLHIHDVDYALFALGAPRSVQARGKIGPSGGIDQIVSWFDYGADGPMVQMEGSWMAGQAVPFVMGFRMYFEQASLVYSSEGGEPMQLYDGDGARDVEVPPVSAYEAELDHFIQCVRSGRNSQVASPESARQAVAVALAEVESIRTARPVDIRQAP